MRRDTGGAHGEILSANQRRALAGGDQSQPCIAARAPAGSDVRERQSPARVAVEQHFARLAVEQYFLLS